MAIQLIIFPQIYDGYFSYTGPNTTGGGTGNGNGILNDGGPVPYQIPNQGTQFLGNPTFNQGLNTNLTVDAIASGFASTIPRLMDNSLPIGLWNAICSSNVSNPPSTATGSLKLDATQTGEVNTLNAVATKVDQLQAGNSYRVLVTIDDYSGDPDKSNLRLGITGGFEFQEGERTMQQCGGRNGMLQGGEGWVDAETGKMVGNPLSVWTTPGQRYYQDFIAQSNLEVLQLSFQSEGGAGNTIDITKVSLVSSTHHYPDRNNPTIDQYQPDGLIRNNPVQASGSVTTYLTDGQVILDLYKDESIPLNLSVDNFTNVDEKIASYSKSFLIPATKRNNIIFSHYFDVTRTQNHDPYVFNPFAKTKALIKDDTVTIFEGWMKLINVQEKDQQVSYNINLYSEPTTFCDYLKASTIGELDFMELGHNYDWDTIQDSWDDTVGIPLTTPLNVNSFAYDPALGVNNTNVMKYPVQNWTGTFQLFQITNPADTIAAMGFESMCRPFVNCKYLLDKMFEVTPFTYESNFLNGAYFKKLFMDFNWGAASQSLAATFTVLSPDVIGSASSSTGGSSTAPGAWVQWNMPNMVNENPAGTQYTYYDPITGVMEIQYNDTTVIGMGVPRFKRTHHNTEGEWRVVRTDFISGLNVVEHTGAISFNDSMHPSSTPTTSCWDQRNDCTLLPSVNHECGAGNASSSMYAIVCQENDLIRWEFRKSAGCGGIHLSNNTDVTTWAWSSYKDIYNVDEKNVQFFQISGGQSTMDFLMQGLRGQMKQYDFWAGLKEMFNLVTMPDASRPNHLVIEPYNDIFIDNPNSRKWDWTQKVDLKNIKHEPLNKIPKRTIFGYDHDEKDYRLSVYQKALAGYYYGDKTYEAGSQFFSILTGEKKITAKPFAPTLVAPLSMIHPDFIVSHIYSANDEGTEFQPFDNKPRILYDNGLKPMPPGITLVFLLWGGWVQMLSVVYGQMTHLSECPTTGNTIDLNFGECPLVNPVGSPTVNNLFNTYWAPYYNELYNPDVRVLKLKMALTPQDIEEFSFYDTVFVKNREYRVNKIKYNSDRLASVELILIT